jgi:polar amino acid transport system substrate-binding protein
MRRTSLVSFAIAGTFLFAACGSSKTTTAPATGGAAEVVGKAADCKADKLALKAKGKLTVATGTPAFLPWVEDDKPESGKGFEAALVASVARELGLKPADVTWVRTGFDEAVAPGAKAYDFNLQQYSINDDRKKVVDFSSGYYTVQQAIIAPKGSSAIGAKSLADLKGKKLGAAKGTTSLNYIDDIIKPTTKASVYDDNAGVKSAFEAKQIDAAVFDLPTAYFVTAVEIPDASIVGLLPAGGAAEQLGMLFEKGSKLTPCVNLALATITKSGELTKLQAQWLASGGSIPTLTK